MIAIGLMALLLGAVFQFVIANAKFEKTIEKAEHTLLEREKLQEKLEAIFTTAKSFATQEGSLQVRFDAGIDPDPLFSGEQTVILFTDKKKQLCCVQKTPFDEKTCRTDILLSGVTSLEWSFWDGKKKSWVLEWPKENGHSPELIRLKVSASKATHQHAFILPTQKPVVMTLLYLQTDDHKKVITTEHTENREKKRAFRTSVCSVLSVVKSNHGYVR